jgi:hypothetical protein
LPSGRVRYAMMATTHVFVGLALVAPVAVVDPELATPLAVGAIAGGLTPDLDLVADHRRTFHFPVLGLPAAGLAVGAALLAPEMDPWTEPGDRAVYDHLRGRWLRPRRWIRYDGAPEDGLAAFVLAIPSLLVFEGWIAAVIAVGLGISVGYVALRRRLVAWLPQWLE